MRKLIFTIVGRLLNRMTKDIGLIDDLLPQTCFDVLEVSINRRKIFGS